MTSAVSPPSTAASFTGLRALTLGTAMIPVAALGTPSDIPMESRVLASILWVLCLLPAWHYLHLPMDRRPPIPFMPLAGGAYLFYYPLRPVLGQSSVNYLFRMDPGFDYGPAVQYALIAWVAVLVGYVGASSFRLHSRFDRFDQLIPQRFGAGGCCSCGAV